MATIVLQQTSLLLMLILATVALDCGQIVQSQRNEIGRTRRLLEAMGGQRSPTECPEDPDFGFPMEKTVLNSNKEDARMAIGFFLEQIQTIFQHNYTQTNWNMTATDLFQETLDQQQIQWQRCSIVRTREQATRHGLHVKRTLKMYFTKLHIFLKEKEYSLCAWDAVRGEIFEVYSVVLSKLLGKL
nr:interferon alpha-5-like [Pogona vitticeps]